MFSPYGNNDWGSVEARIQRLEAGAQQLKASTQQLAVRTQQLEVRTQQLKTCTQQLEVHEAGLRARVDTLWYFRALSILGDCAEYVFDTADSELQDIVKALPDEDSRLHALAQFLHFRSSQDLKNCKSLYYKALTTLFTAETVPLVPVAVYDLLACVEQASGNRLAARGVYNLQTADRSDILQELHNLVKRRQADPFRIMAGPLLDQGAYSLHASTFVKEQLENGEFGYLSPAAVAS